MQNKQYLIGLDNGGSVIKCAIFDTQGREVTSATRRLAVSMPQPGFTERDMEDVWNANCESIREAMQKGGVAPEDVLAIAPCGYGNGICLIDAEGNPTYPCIVSTDNRAADYLVQWMKDGRMKEVYRYTFQDIWAAQPAALFAWFRDHDPEVLERSACYLMITDYVRFRLTGEVATERTISSGSNLMNIRTQQFDPQLLSILSLSEYTRLIPKKLIRSDELAGTVSEEASQRTGLLAGTPVAGGVFDVDACCAASGVVEPSKLCLITGTWSINEYVTHDTSQSADKWGTTLSFLRENPYLIGESSPTSASNLNWFIDKVIKPLLPELTDEACYAYCNRAVEEIGVDESDIVFVPYLYASNTNPKAKGAFFNMQGYYDVRHMIRAIYEGIVFSSVYHVRRLMKWRDAFTVARLSGGIKNAPVWTQMLCDALQIPIEVVSGKELGAMGAAMSAGVCCGCFESFEAAVESMVHVSEVYTPDASRAASYERKMALFMKALKCVSAFADEDGSL